MVTGFFSDAGKAGRLILAFSLLFFVVSLVDAQEGPPTTNPPTATAKQPAAQPAVPSPPTVTPPPQPSTPVALAIQALLKDGVHPKLRWKRFSDFQTPLEALYQASGYDPLWIHDDKPTNQARLAVTSLGSADDKGLDASDYDAESLKKWLGAINASTNTSPQELASFDSALSISLMRYAYNLNNGRINPKQVNFALDIQPKSEDLPALLRKISTSSNPDKLLASMEPKLKLYDYLKDALAHYRQLAKEAPVAPIQLPNKFKPGDHHADVPKVRKLLSLLGDLTEGNANDA